MRAYQRLFLLVLSLITIERNSGLVE